MMQKKYFALLLATFLWSCNDPKEDAAAVNQSALLEEFLLPQAPADALKISEVFADPTPGREVVIFGEVIGRNKPFVPERAMMTLGDPTKITPCGRVPGDECPVPWATCCDDPDVVKKSITTIQFLDKEGKIIKAGLKGCHGIKEMSYLTIKGKIAEGSSAENLLINAEGFHITDPSPYLNALPVQNYAEDDVEVTASKDPAP